MKGVIFYIAFVFCCLLPVSTVYAGSLNEYEKQVVAEARKTYTYQGKMYQVDEKYIDQLIAYLSQDDVDITAEQRDKALQTAYNSIERGVLDGYLIPVEEPVEESAQQATPMPTITVTPEPSEIDEAKNLSQEEKEQIDQFFGETSNTSIITETGFNFEHTLIVIVGIVMLMIFGFVANCRMDYFAQNDE